MYVSVIHKHAMFPDWYQMSPRLVPGCHHNGTRLVPDRHQSGTRLVSDQRPVNPWFHKPVVSYLDSFSLTQPYEQRLLQTFDLEAISLEQNVLKQFSVAIS